MGFRPIELPGYGLPLNVKGPSDSFPNILMEGDALAITVRERTIMALVDSITAKPAWDSKVFDEGIVRKWRQEALDNDRMDVTERMLDWVSTLLLLFVASFSKMLAESGARFHNDLHSNHPSASVIDHLDAHAQCHEIKCNRWKSNIVYKATNLDSITDYCRVTRQSKILPKGRHGFDIRSEYCGSKV